MEMIKIDGNKTYVQLGEGDVSLAPCTTSKEYVSEGAEPRRFVVLLQCEPGSVGKIEEVNRDSVIKSGYVFAEETKPVVGIESSSVESLDMLIDTLLGYRHQAFGKVEDGECIDDGPSRNEIQEIAKYDPVVSRALSLWRKGCLSYEEMLILAVRTLVQQNDELRDHALDVCINQGVLKG
jgi:hypothetical protein